MTASLSHDRPCLVSTFCTSVGPIKPPPYSRPVSRPFGMFARTFSSHLGTPPLPPPCGKEARRATSRRPSQFDAWNRSALSEGTVRDRKLRQLRLASSRIQGLRAGRGRCLLCMPHCRVATWRSSVVLGNAGGDHTGAHIKACNFKSPIWCFLALCQPSLLINSAPPKPAGSWVSLLLSSEEHVGRYRGGKMGYPNHFPS